MSHHTVVHRAQNWFLSRIQEPSSWAAFAVAAVGVSVLIGNFWVAVAGIAIAGVAVLLKEGGIW